MAIASIDHISLDERGSAFITGTRIKVLLIAQEIQEGRTIQDIQASYEHLSLAQIYAALSYYFDHQQEIDEEAERRNRWVAEWQAQNPNRLTREILEERLKNRASSPDP